MKKKNGFLKMIIMSVGLVILFLILREMNQEKKNLSINENIEVNETVKEKKSNLPEVVATPIAMKAPLAPKAVNAPIPVLPPKVTKPISFNIKNNISDRSIKFSKRIPPNYIPDKFEKEQRLKKEVSVSLGKVSNGKIAAYLRGSYLNPSIVEEKLKAGNFTILNTFPVDKEGTLISVVFTDSSLINLGSKNDRGFVSTLRVLIDTKENTININNPIYVLKGFLQEDFDKKIADDILLRLTSNFEGLKDSKDFLKYQLVSKYHFMTSMPYYKDMENVASGENLFDKIKDNVVFSQKLKNGSMLVGVNLESVSNFTNIIGRGNSGLMPYPILIENGKAKILEPKYYISFMYPMLSMSNFMKIKDVPDDIVRECKGLFN